MDIHFVQILLVCLSTSAGVAGAVLNIYIGYRDLDTVWNIFSKSYAIWYHGWTSQWSFRARISHAYDYASVLGWSSRYLRNGMLIPEEYSRLPIPIRKRMWWSMRLTGSGVLGIWVSIFWYIFSRAA